MADTFTDLLDRLEGVRLRGDQADARCPAHDDRKASLSIARGAAGRILLQCHAGCGWRDVLTAVGLEPSTAFGEPYLLREHTYTDAAGLPLYVVERWEPKAFKQRLANGQRRSPKPGERVLYNLPVVTWVREHGPVKSVFMVEGERDVETLAALGYAATTTVMGAGKPWQPQYTEALSGMHVVIIADNDTAGRKWARTVGDHLAGHATVQIVIPPKGIKDVTEMVEAGFAVTDLLPLPDTIGEVTAAADYPIKQVEWLWPGRLPANTLTLLEGDPGTGKSSITVELIACLTTGRPLPGLEGRRAPMRVGVLSDEDSWSAVVAPKLMAAGADLGRVLHFKGIRQGDYLAPYSLSDLATLRHDLRKVGVGMLVIDPVMAYLGDNGLDSYRDQHVRSILGPLVQMAEEDAVTIIAIRHFSKGSLGGKAIYRGGGSIGFTGQARVVLQTAEHPEDENKRVLAVAKCNLAPLAPSLAYGLVTDPIYSVGRVAWDDLPVPWGAQQLQRVPTTQGDADESSARRDAKVWLANYLADFQARPWLEVVAAAKEDGHSEHTLRRIRGEVAEQVIGSEGNRSSRWQRSLAQPSLDKGKHQMGSGGNAQAGDEHSQPVDNVTYLPHVTPHASLPKVGEDGQVVDQPVDNQVGPPGQAAGPPEQAPEPGPPVCSVCGGDDGLVIYSEPEGARCRLHNPLVWTGEL